MIILNLIYKILGIINIINCCNIKYIFKVVFPVKIINIIFVNKY